MSFHLETLLESIETNIRLALEEEDKRELYYIISDIQKAANQASEITYKSVRKNYVRPIKRPPRRPRVKFPLELEFLEEIGL